MALSTTSHIKGNTMGADTPVLAMLDVLRESHHVAVHKQINHWKRGGRCYDARVYRRLLWSPSKANAIMSARGCKLALVDVDADAVPKFHTFARTDNDSAILHTMCTSGP